MNTFGAIFKWFFSLMRMPLHIYGYSISFWQIFVFLCLAAISAVLIRALLH